MVKGKTKRFARGTAHPREQTTRPDLRRLTRRILQVAELLPWPVKDGLSHTNATPSEAGGKWGTKFSGGDGLEPAHGRGNPLER